LLLVRPQERANDLRSYPDGLALTEGSAVVEYLWAGGWFTVTAIRSFGRDSRRISPEECSRCTEFDRTRVWLVPMTDRAAWMRCSIPRCACLWPLGCRALQGWAEGFLARDRPENS